MRTTREPRIRCGRGEATEDLWGERCRGVWEFIFGGQGNKLLERRGKSRAHQPHARWKKAFKGDGIVCWGAIPPKNRLESRSAKKGNLGVLG